MLKSLEIGNFSFEYDSGDLFRLKWKGDEVIQRAYVALRDEHWNTIPAAISDLDIQHGKDSLTISFLAKHTFENIDFSWRGEIYANIFDELHLKMNGTVNGEFNYCKIGLNIHHGLTAYRDLKFIAKTLAGDYSSSFGPDLVPQLVHDRVLTAMTPHYEELHVEFPKFKAEFSFLGGSTANCTFLLPRVRRVIESFSGFAQNPSTGYWLSNARTCNESAS
jgi:hypothetical protein